MREGYPLPASEHNPFKNPGLTNPFTRPPATFDKAKEDARAIGGGAVGAVADATLKGAAIPALPIVKWWEGNYRSVVVYGTAILFIVFGLKGVFK